MMLFAPKYLQIKKIPYVSPALEVFIPALLKAETDDRQVYKSGRTIKSAAGAIGRWQVMPDCLGYFNQRTGSNYKVSQLSDDKVNEIVGRWYLQYCYVLSRSNIVLAINRYHQGHNADKHRLYKSYLLDICPAEYERYMRNKRVIESIKCGKREWVVWE